MPNLTVGVILMKDRANVLLAKPRTGPDVDLWTIPDTFVSDGETVRNAAIRCAKENFDLDTEPRMTLFICERVVSDDHRIGVFVLAEPVVEPGKEPQLAGGETYGRYLEAKWADVRTLGDIQKNEGMSDFTADAFVKFSDFLRSKAPTSGTVN